MYIKFIEIVIQCIGILIHWDLIILICERNETIQTFNRIIRFVKGSIKYVYITYHKKKDKFINIQWTPRNCGLHRNEMANKLTTEGTVVAR